MTERQRKVALLIDYDNLQICFSRDAPGTQLDISAVVQFAQSYGRVVAARAYAEWNLLPERIAIWKQGVEPAFAPVMRPDAGSREGKSLCDTVMVADGIDLLWTIEPDVLVLVTSDKDMIPLARMARQRGTLVVVLGSDLTAVQLIECANDFVTYRNLLSGLGRSEDKTAAPRLREEPPARRARTSVQRGAVATGAARASRVPREAQEVSTLRRPRPVSAAPAAEEPVPAAEGEPVDASLAAEPGAAGPRRRRRRGGRGRRTAGSAAAELVGEPLEGGEEELDGTGSLESSDARGESETDGQVSELTEPIVGEFPGAELPPAPAFVQPRLKPWERWPEPGLANSLTDNAGGDQSDASPPESAARIAPDSAAASAEVETGDSEPDKDSGRPAKKSVAGARRRPRSPTRKKAEVAAVEAAPE